MDIDKYKKIGIDNSKCIDKSYLRKNIDSYYLDIAFSVSKRSHDSNTQQGCIIVKNNRIISTGFNGFPANSPDSIIPNNRYENHKYKFINHAEINAIFSCAKNGISLDNSVIYITGIPCSSCARALVSVGIHEWKIGNIQHVTTEEEELLRQFWIECFDVKITKIKM